VWEFLNDNEFGETMVRPVEKLPVESLDNRVVGAQVHLANGSQVWASFGNFDVTNPRATQHFLEISIERNGEWFDLARYHDVDFSKRSWRRLLAFLAYTLTMYSRLPWRFGDMFGEILRHLQLSC
jgi:hypothetical protein